MKKQLITYCLIAYTITWVIGFGIYFLSRDGYLTGNQLNFFHSLAALGPAIGALTTTYYYYGSHGVHRLLAHLTKKLPNQKVMLLVLSPLFFFVLGVVVYRIVNGQWYDFRQFSDTTWGTSAGFFGWLLPLLAYAIFEEIGWRGFLLPHLQEKYNAWTATCYLAIIWALWHIPFFLYRFNFSVFMAIGFFFGIFVGAIILTSLFNSSRGALVSAILFHFFNNLFSMFDKELIAAVLSTGFVFIAIYIYKSYGKEDLSPVKRTKNYFQ